MLPYRDSKITRFLLIVFFLLVLAYAIFEATGFLFGPSIQVPIGATEVHTPQVHISGKAERISSLSMNGAPVTVTEDGTFDQLYLLSPGDNRIVLDASDKYGRTRQEVVEIVYVPEATSSLLDGTTTPPEASTTPVAQ